jgi:tRNA-Thr(GGU) m(6)t(6)A37 methyltransferase TsaA
METLQGIDGYSHAWIIFLFHANTDLAESKKTKIRPPRAPKGVKVGQLATRSPHRPNPIGLSLIRIEYVDYAAKRLYISALDIVNGTPVFDIVSHCFETATFSFVLVVRSLLKN